MPRRTQRATLNESLFKRHAKCGAKESDSTSARLPDGGEGETG